MRRDALLGHECYEACERLTSRQCTENYETHWSTLFLQSKYRALRRICDRYTSAPMTALRVFETFIRRL